MWKKEFIEKVYPIIKKDQEEHLKSINYGFKLKEVNMPEKLYKYNWLDSGKNYSIDNFSNDQVYLNKPEKFNDIFDCRLAINIKELMAFNSIKMHKKILEEFSDVLLNKNLTVRQFIRCEWKSNKNYKKYKRISQKLVLKNIKNSVKNFEDINQKKCVITCFSETFDSNLMWGHYSNKHSGFVLEYNFKELGYREILNRIIFPVIYQDEFFNMTEFFKNFSEKNLNNFYLNLPTLFKSSDWKHEKEWRLIIGNGIFKEETLYTIPTAKAIYLGIRINLEHKKILINIAKSKNLKIYQMELSRERYELKYTEIKY